MRKRAVLKIYGWVQGVSYRWHTKRRAKQLNLVGWVRNESDGTVKVVAEGEEGDLKRFVERCYNEPKWARIERVDVRWQEAREEFDKFKIRY